MQDKIFIDLKKPIEQFKSEVTKVGQEVILGKLKLTVVEKDLNPTEAPKLDQDKQYQVGEIFQIGPFKLKVLDTGVIGGPVEEQSSVNNKKRKRKTMQEIHDEQIKNLQGAKNIVQIVQYNYLCSSRTSAGHTSVFYFDAQDVSTEVLDILRRNQHFDLSGTLDDLDQDEKTFGEWFYKTKPLFYVNTEEFGKFISGPLNIVITIYLETVISSDTPFYREYEDDEDEQEVPVVQAVKKTKNE